MTTTSAPGTNCSTATDPAALAFIPITDELVARWDTEWCRYFALDHGKIWFEDLSQSSADAVDCKKRLLACTTAEDTFRFQVLELHKGKLALWVLPEDLVDRDVCEIGCGPGQLGKQLGHLARHYLGTDFSRLALNIARIISPRTCRYVHLSDHTGLATFCGTRDLVATRHFFIHQNFESAQWVTRLAALLLKPGGTLVADYYLPNDQSKTRGQVFGPAKSPWNPDKPSSLFCFEDEEIQAIASNNGLEIESVHEDPELQRRYVRMVKTT